MPTFTDNESGTFAPGKCNNKKTVDLVLGKNGVGEYLQAKIGNYFGIKASTVVEATPITIDDGYANSEGVITSMEQKPGFLKGLRIDLQKAQVVDGHTYATFQVQWGTGSDGKTGGAWCGALMRVDNQFTVGDLRTALIHSVGTQTYWRIDP